MPRYNGKNTPQVAERKAVGHFTVLANQGAVATR
jgi:hypothetical protein